MWFIDVIGDKTSIDKGNLLSSVVWNLVPVYSAMVEDLKADKFGTKGYSIQLSDDSVQLLKTKHIPDDVWADVIEGARRDRRRHAEDRAGVGSGQGARADDLGHRRARAP